jgi:hypothetical protein
MMNVSRRDDSYQLDPVRTWIVEPEVPNPPGLQKTACFFYPPVRLSLPVAIGILTRIIHPCLTGRQAPIRVPPSR